MARYLGTTTSRYRARVTVHAPAEELLTRLPPGVEVAEVTGEGCVVAVGSDTPHMLADFDVTGPPELVAKLDKLADRYARAVGRTSA